MSMRKTGRSHIKIGQTLWSDLHSLACFVKACLCEDYCWECNYCLRCYIYNKCSGGSHYRSLMVSLKSYKYDPILV
jgi:hypothetical protein